MKLIFTSDWHLSPDTPTLTLFFTYLMEKAQNSAIFILGDLFDFWVGDDQLKLEYYANIALSIKNSACPVFIMRGNRDFLLGEEFARATQAKILPDPFLIEYGEKKILLSHGDQYCTDDLPYMAFLKKTRNPVWQQEILKKPFEERMAMANTIRQASQANKDGTYTDLNPQAIEELLKKSPCDFFIHGHTHQCGIHKHNETTRFVLDDWQDYAQVPNESSPAKDTQMLVFWPTPSENWGEEGDYFRLRFIGAVPFEEKPEPLRGMEDSWDNYYDNTLPYLREFEELEQAERIKAQKMRELEKEAQLEQARKEYDKRYDAFLFEKTLQEYEEEQLQQELAYIAEKEQEAKEKAEKKAAKKAAKKVKKAKKTPKDEAQSAENTEKNEKTEE